MAIAVSRKKFGGTSPAMILRLQTRWIVGGLVGIVLILGSTISVLAIATMKEQDPAAPAGQNGSGFETQPAMVELLTASRRIEQSEEIDETMVSVQRVKPEQVPDGAILASEREEVLGKFAQTLITPRLALVREQLSADRPQNIVSIPDGSRAIAIIADNRNCMDGLLVPNSRVDVMWTYQSTLQTLATFRRVISINGDKKTGGSCAPNVPVTLEVTEEEAQNLELARTGGVLSLSLYGPGSTAKRFIDPNRQVTMNDLQRGKDVKKPRVRGKVYYRDQSTGEEIEGELLEDNWEISRLNKKEAR